MTTTNKRINVLVYTGEGTTTTSLSHTFFTLRRLLSPTYIILPLSTTALLSEPWQPTAAALIIPGGADLPYVRALHGAGVALIKQFVANGGKYVGFCAGGYFASERCEFMAGVRGMEVLGGRELGFFPGVCRGLVFGGFVYASEERARAVELRVERDAFAAVVGGGGGEKGDEKGLPETVRSYYHGGGVFVDADADEMKEKGVEVLARYVGELDCEPGSGNAAVVYRKIGNGAVLLTGTHPEFASSNLDKNARGEGFRAAVEALEKDEDGRIAFLRACLTKLGLEANHSSQLVPSPSPIHLTALDLDHLPTLLEKWAELMVKTDAGHVVIQGDNDIFNIKDLPSDILPQQKSDVSAITQQLGSLTLPIADGQDKSSDEQDRIVDYDKLIKHIQIHTNSYPTIRETPKFNHQNFYLQLEKYAGSRLERSTFGKYLFYAEVITSTSTILEKNNTLLRTLPTGFTATASTQISGRGRGSNVWVSPPGSLMFSTVIWHPISLATASAPVVFIQYLAAMAVVRGVQSYARGYDKLPLRLKWPNDVYALDASAAKKGSTSGAAGSSSYVKIGGILVNSTYSGEQYGLVVGVGVNVANAAPTTGLDALAAAAGLPAFETEKLLARILTVFEELYLLFCREGWGEELERMYYGMWLHSDQIITIETENNLRAKIRGITRDWGMLQAEELGWEDRPTGRLVALQTDSNSFDFFRGLIKRKI